MFTESTAQRDGNCRQGTTRWKNMATLRSFAINQLCALGVATSPPP